MNGLEVIDYLTDNTARDMSRIGQNVALANIASAYGYRMNLGELGALFDGQEYSTYGDTDRLTWNERMERELQELAEECIAYLNEQGIVPRAYDHGERDIFAGYGNATARDDAARRDAVTGRGEGMGEGEGAGA